MAQKQAGGFANKKKSESNIVGSTPNEVLSAQEAIQKLDQAASGQIKVIHGSADGVFDNLVGVQVSTVRNSLVNAFNIPADATCFINGEQVSEDYVLQASQVCEFVKKSGIKG